jgi:hypothetical protein
MFYPNKTILIVSKRDLDAKVFLARNIKFAYDHLPKAIQKLWPLAVCNEHEVGFANGSVIRSLTSGPDTLRSNASSLNIIDEAAFCPNMEAMWGGGWSTLQHGGFVIVISCVTRDTYVFTDQGPCKIGDFVDQSKSGGYITEKYAVLGKSQFREGNLFYNSGKARTRKVVTRHAELEASLAHKMWACKDGRHGWHKIENLDKGDWLSIQYGMNKWGSDDSLIDIAYSTDTACPFRPTALSTDLGYLIGLYIAEGSRMLQNGREIGITLTCGDDLRPILDRLGLNYSCNDGLHYCICNKNLVELFRGLGFDLSAWAPKKVIPGRLLRCSKPIIASIISGMFDGDGHSRHTRNGQLGYATTSKELHDQLRILLNNFGILATSHVRTKEKANEYIKRNNKGKVKRHNHDTHILEMGAEEARVFHKEIGFGFSRKSMTKKLCADKRLSTSWDVIPYSLDLCHELFDILPFGTWVLKYRYKLTINPIVSKKTRYKTEHISRQTVSRLFEIAKPYLTAQRIAEIEKILDPHLMWVPITNIEEGEAEVFDFSLPDNPQDPWAHSVIYNGLLGHQTPNGLGDWYWSTYTSAVDGLNNFNPIRIHWWDMDWVLAWKDPITGKEMRISPTDGLRKCTDKEEIEKYGEYWSPWLENEYRGLQQRGEAHLFKQEVLAEFLGSGGTIVPPAALRQAGKIVEASEKPEIITDLINYVNPITGEEDVLDFNGAEKSEGLWIWKHPVTPKPAVVIGRKVVEPAVPGHIYVAGVDTSTGKNNDFCSIEVFDIMEMEQVAELMLRAPSLKWAKMVDWVGRLYNNALLCVERTGIGYRVVDDLIALMYPNLWRKKNVTPQGTTYGPYGFATTDASKPLINKSLIDCISENEGEGYIIRSHRLWRQLQIYIRKRDRHGRDTNKIGAQEGKGNYDDLVIGAGLAFVAAPDAVDADPAALIPTRGANIALPDMQPQDRAVEQRQIITVNDPSLIMPYSRLQNNERAPNTEMMIEQFSAQLISREPIMPAAVVRRKNPYSH